MTKAQMIAIMAATIYGAKPYARRPSTLYVQARMDAMIEAAQEAEMLWDIITNDQHQRVAA